MKIKLTLLLLFFSLIGFSQEIYFFKDANKEFTIKTIKEQSFKKAGSDVIDKNVNAFYWFKIPKFSADESYVFQVKNIEILSFETYEGDKLLEELPFERYPAVAINPEVDTYVKVFLNTRADFPLALKPYSTFQYDEKKNILINSFYYGFSFLVILYSIFYFFFFKDSTYIYYAIFLFFITLAFILIDGLFNLFGFSTRTITVLLTITYVGLAYFSSKFINNFLVLEEFYPNLKKYTYTIGSIIVLLAIAYLYSDVYLLYQILSILVYALMCIYWIMGIILFNKNVFTKILVIGFALILFGSLDAYILTYFGYSFLNSSAIQLKVGGIVQIVALWFAVVIRERSLKIENTKMKNDILNFTNELNSSNNKDYQKSLLEELTLRELEIFNLISEGKTNKQIANKISVSVNTVKFHIKNIYEKLNIHSRKEISKFN